jgi:hypothetical protein
MEVDAEYREVVEFGTIQFSRSPLPRDTRPGALPFRPGAPPVVALWDPGATTKVDPAAGGEVRGGQRHFAGRDIAAGGSGSNPG